MSAVLFRKINLTSVQLCAMQQLRANASSSSTGSIVQQGSIVLDNTKAPPPLSAERVRTHPKIGNREIVGYGLKGKPEYFDLVMFPCPSIRWEADTPQIAALRNKEKSDWKQLTIEEKKKLYRASFRQTFEEFTAPTGEWKSSIGWLFISLSGLVLAYDVWRRVCYSFDPPDSLKEDKLKKQLEFHIAARQGPATGLSSKWDYETGTWKK